MSLFEQFGVESSTIGLRPFRLGEKLYRLHARDGTTSHRAATEA
jgi:hypothetical protein